ncbi:MAG: Hsp20/alpha crystallin family protein [Gammaproteobacteria bacterium]|nr:Hsp20/alpha crystallin family protein [Gammaproteobacteria bacterium]
MLARMNVQPTSLWREFNNIENWLSAANGQLENASRWMPSVDVIEREDHYILKADLPGVDRKDIEIVFEDGALTLKGERSDNSESDHDGYKRLERSYGGFLRSFRMPENIDADNITAKSEHGVLEVRVPKQEKSQKKIKVQ